MQAEERLKVDSSGTGCSSGNQSSDTERTLPETNPKRKKHIKRLL